jgi:hypothetical protein
MNIGNIFSKEKSTMNVDLPKLKKNPKIFKKIFYVNRMLGG